MTDSRTAEEIRDRRNQFAFGIGTFGRDATYTLISLYLIFYLTDVIRVTGATLATVTAVIVAARIFDALNDPFVGVLIDNTHSRWGKFRPWITVGAIFTALFTVLLFVDYGNSGARFVLIFSVLYLLWGIAYTANDVGYWSMLPALSRSQRTREKIGSLSRIAASLGAFSMVVGIVPITSALKGATGSEQRAYFVLAASTVVLLLVFQSVTVIFAREDPRIIRGGEHTRFRELARIIFKNDQLLTVAVAMTLFMIGYNATISLGLYYFKYVYGDEGMYSVFALVLGVAQIGTLAVYPMLGRRFTRERIFAAAMVLVTAGYVVFFFAPAGNMVVIGSGGLLMFVGQALIQVLILMFITDSVEYGQWKLGRQNESVTFSMQPLINKLSAAVASGVVGATVLLAHTQDVPEGEVLTGTHLLIFKTAMMILPLVLIGISYAVYRRHYRIDAEFYATIVEDLREREEQSRGL